MARRELLVTQHMLLRLQRQYGNRYVGHVLQLAEDSAVGARADTLDQMPRALDPTTGPVVVSRLDESAPGLSAERERPAPAPAENSSVRPRASRVLKTADPAVGRQLVPEIQRGEHRPGTSEGEALMTHELAHGAEQHGAPTTGPLTVSQPRDATGRDATAFPAHVLQRKPKRRPAQTITFGEEEGERVEGAVRTLDPSSLGTAEQEILNQIAEVRSRLVMTEKNILTALDQFSDDQGFSSSAEGEADFTGAFISYAVTTILEQLAGHLGKEGGALPGLGTVWSITFGLVNKLKEEDERADKARGERAVAKFLGSYRAKITTSFDEQVTALPKVSDALIVEYARLAELQPGTAKPTRSKGAPAGTQPAVAGDAARLLLGLKDYVKGLKPPTFEKCLQTIIEAWVGQSEGKLESRGGGDIYYDGRINITMDIYKDGDRYTKRSKPKGFLQAPRADHVIDSMKIMFDKGKTTNDFSILKVVRVRVEDEIDWGGNDYYEVVVEFRKKGDLESVRTMGHPRRRAEVVDRRAPEVERQVLRIVTFDELALTELKPGER